MLISKDIPAIHGRSSGTRSRTYQDPWVNTAPNHPAGSPGRPEQGALLCQKKRFAPLTDDLEMEMTAHDQSVLGGLLVTHSRAMASCVLEERMSAEEWSGPRGVLVCGNQSISPPDGGETRGHQEPRLAERYHPPL